MSNANVQFHLIEEKTLSQESSKQKKIRRINGNRHSHFRTYPYVGADYNHYDFRILQQLQLSVVAERSLSATKGADFT
jgi:hypothetical protein